MTTRGRSFAIALIVLAGFVIVHKVAAEKAHKKSRPRRVHSPRDNVAALALENHASSADGWELILVDDQGVMRHKPAVGRGHDLMPACRPDGAELAFLGQVTR